MAEQNKVCPLKWMNSENQGRAKCIGDECAWWYQFPRPLADGSTGKCCIMLGVQQLGSLSNLTNLSYLNPIGQ
ncbi:hypothetical protein JXM67_11600 [candidate division WOR-3 bacterium]|nr:hypothetical protein [candidate division WOR-3 bacterium]